jgi:sporulation protein YlmC with PRC-barrel domain
VHKCTLVGRGSKPDHAALLGIRAATKMRLGLVVVTMAAALGTSEVAAQCNISDAKLEEAILLKPELRDRANRQIVSDLRTLRDAALILWSYDRQDDCNRVLANIRELLASPSIGALGNNDEDEADQQLAAGEPALHSGGQAVGNRHKAGASPLIDIDQLGPGLRVDEILGAEVRSSDDKIIGEVRNVVIGTRDGQDYVVVASGGFFIPGKESIVVPLRFLQINQERDSFFLRISEVEMRKVPLMPDQDYEWLADQAWRTRNDAIFESLMPTPDRVGQE